MPGTTQTHVTREVIGNIVALRGSRNLMTPNLMISNDATYCHTGRFGYRLGRPALDLGLQAIGTASATAGPVRAGVLVRGAQESADLRGQEGCGFSGTSLSLSAIRPSSGSEWAFIFRIALLRWTFTVASAMPISPAICLLRRPRAT